MQIAYLVGSFPTISETFVLNQITGMIDRGHNVKIFSLRRPIDKENHPDVKKYKLLEKTVYLPKGANNRWLRRMQGVIFFPWFCLRNPRLLYYLRNWYLLRGVLDVSTCALARYFKCYPAFDIVHAQFGPLGAKLARLKIAGVITCPLITSFRGGDVTIILSKDPHYYDNLFSSGDLFLAVSSFIRNRLTKHGCPEDRTFVHHSGIDLKVLTYRKPLILTVPARVRVLCIARLVEVKGVSYLIEAIVILLKKGYDIILDIVGDGPLKRTHQKQVSNSGIDQNVYFHGFLTKKDVHDLLLVSHLLVIPSIVGSDKAEEGMPNSIKEGMALGVPVISTRTGGIPELIKDGMSGFLVQQKKALALAEKISCIIDTPAVLHKITKTARKTVEQNFDIEQLNDKLNSYYLALANSK